MDPVDNPGKERGVQMTNSDLEPTASDLEALESKRDKEKTQRKLKAYSDTL